ncbi:hypothetical protein ACFST9_05080 [Hymenobacter monticola]|uniref:Uncharacterized protein n=1 Tax=Hymenobacter monticola TaxID=1705399 RepID=A0ABY4BAQ6_9BACT|nr:hypothetical protein [Hymenobacter monticola]UOE35994.1 hypothetical protein MTP16_10210 [Hymenobacter monticola]
MKKQLLCAGFFLSLALPAFAQQPVPSAIPSRADSVQAVHRLFSKHRTGGIVWSIIGAAAAGRIAGAAAGGNSSGNGGGTAVGILVFGGVPAGIGIGKLVRFSNGREDAAVRSLEAGKGLPHYVQRRLKKAKYFMN